MLLIFVLGVISKVIAAPGAGIVINFDDENQLVLVEQCFVAAPDFIESKDREIIGMTRNMQWQGHAVSYKRGYVELPDNQAGCVSYGISTKKNNTSKRLQQPHNSSVIKIDQLLWQVRNAQSRPLPQVTFNHSAKIRVSTPWRLIKRVADQTIYQIQASPKYSSGFVAFGALQQTQITLGDSNLRLSIIAGEHTDKTDMITRWVKTMADAVAQVGDGFPIKSTQVLVVLISGSNGVVPWGQVNRAGGTGVLFVVNANKSEQALFSDWTAAHEFSHLLTPYTASDRWLSEGFASYHQNISRLRAGILDEKTAWRKMLAGFERGRKSAAKSSAPVLKNAGRRHNMQMYWGGAVIALKADVALHQASGGSMNLSKALTGLQACCLDTGEDWSAKRLFRKLDSITQTDVFMTLYQQEVMHKAYPEYQSVLKSLGIETNRSGALRFNSSADLVHIRKQIGGL